MKISLIAGLIIAIFATTSFANRIVCYYGSWAVYRHGPGHHRVEDIDPRLCTHLVYAFVGLEHNGKVKLLDPYNDIGDSWKEGAFTKIQKLKAINPRLKLVAAIGGWNEGSSKYSYVVNDPQLRKVFVESIFDFVLRYKFDGFDLDWEYPNQRGGKESDREAFSQLIAEVAEVFKPRGLELSAAVSANALTNPGSYNCKDLARHLDYINVMTYDLHGSWEKVTGHHTAMYPHPKDGPESRHLNIDFALRYWINCTQAPEKFHIGLAAYGRTFTLADPAMHEIGSPVTGPGAPGKYIPEPGVLGYHEICKEQTEGLWKVYDVKEQEVRYSVKGNLWVGYDDIDTIKRKLKYAKDMRLSGASIWSIDSDDFAGACGMGKYPILRAMNEFFGSGELPPVEKPGNGTSRPPTTPQTTTSPICTSTPTPTKQPCPPNDEFDRFCSRIGQMFGHPIEKSYFFMCAYKDSCGNLRAVRFQCPSGSVFDNDNLVCTH